MNKLIEVTAVIRNRGQLTIPEKVRRVITWLNPNSVVRIITSKEGLIVKHYQPQVNNIPDWKKIWEGINLARSFKGKRGNLSKFIIVDSENH